MSSPSPSPMSLSLLSLLLLLLSSSLLVAPAHGAEVYFHASATQVALYFSPPTSASAAAAAAAAAASPAPRLVTLSPAAAVGDLAAVPSLAGCVLTLPDGSQPSLDTPFERLYAAYLDVAEGALLPSLSCPFYSAPCELRPVVPEAHRHFFDLEKMKDPLVLEQAKKAYYSRLDTQQDYPFTADQITGAQLSTALAWLYQFVTHHWGPLHPFPTYSSSSTGIFDLATGQQLQYTGQRVGPSADDGEVRMVIAADWGAGTRESDYVATVMMNLFNPHYTVHLGDVYYVGTIDEIQSNVLGIAPSNAKQGVLWPHGSIGSFAINGNHETYSRCYGYFDYWLPTLGIADPQTGQMSGQETSYFMLENEYWRFIALDTGYNTYSILLDSNNNTQPAPVIDWLTNVVNIGNESDTRGIVFISHHQYRSAFNSDYTATPQQIADLVPANRTFVWLWGHEHRLAFYNLGNSSGIPLNVYGRCLGVGGFPVSLSSIPVNARQAGLIAYDDRPFDVLPGIFNITVGFNGFSHLSFDGPALNIEYHSLTVDDQGNLSNSTSSLLVTEQYTADLTTGNVIQSEFVIVNPNITVVQSV